MSVEFDVTETLDVTGLTCPMPVVKTKQTIEEVETGGVLQVTATDSGSLSDIDGWAGSTDAVELLEQQETEENGETVYKHFVRHTE